MLADKLVIVAIRQSIVWKQEHTKNMVMALGHFVPVSINPHLQNVGEQEQLMVLQAVVWWTREGAFSEANKSNLEVSRQPLVPLPRPSNWLKIPTLTQTMDNKLSCHPCNANGGIQTKGSSNSKSTGCTSGYPQLHVLRTKNKKQSFTKCCWWVHPHHLYILLYVGRVTYHGTGQWCTHQFFV